MKLPEPAKIFFFLLFLVLCTNAKGIAQETQPYINYRGQRVPADSEDFYPLELSTEPYGQNQAFLSIDIIFSQPVDPRSIKREKIIVNKHELSPASSFHFNKEANLLRLLIREQLPTFFSFSLEDVQSYSGRVMEKFLIEKLGREDKLLYDREDGTWKKS